MAHLVESMFSVREVPWHGLGKVVEEAPYSKEAIKLAGLDWEVNQEPVFVGERRQESGYLANTRKDNGYVLGIVTKRYQVVQNQEAFAFTDELLGQGVKYETAGSLKNGEKIWLLARAPQEKILGDVITPYLCFMNTHTGEGAVRVLITPIRVVCNNTLNLAIDGAPRSWSANHIGSLGDKIASARETLFLTQKYMKNLHQEAHLLADKKLTDADVEDLIQELLPLPEKATERQRLNVIDLQNNLRFRYQKAPDLKKHRGTAWGFMAAVSDFITHAEPKRKTSTFRERRFEKLAHGHLLLDKAQKLLA